MKQSKIIKYMGITLALITTLCLMGTAYAAKASRIIKVGVIGPLSGEGATYGQAMKRGIDMAVEEINLSGGLESVKLVAIYEDSQLSPKGGINAFNKLSQMDKVPIVFGAAGSSVSLAIAPFAQKNKVVLFSSISTADTLKDAGEYFFRNIPPNKIQAITAAYFIKGHLKKQNTSIFYENNDYGINMSEIFSKKFGEIGGEILTNTSYESGQSDFKHQLYKIKAKNPQVIYVPGTYQENALIIRQARQLGMDAVFVAGDGAYSPQLIKIAGKAAEGFYCTLMSLPSKDKSSLVSQFDSKYRKKYGESPNVYSAYSYDAVKMVAEAIRLYLELKKTCSVQGLPSGKNLKDTLQKIWYEGITGITRFDSDGEPADKFYSIYTVKNGAFVHLDWFPEKGQ